MAYKYIKKQFKKETKTVHYRTEASETIYKKYKHILRSTESKYNDEQLNLVRHHDTRIFYGNKHNPKYIEINNETITYSKHIKEKFIFIIAIVYRRMSINLTTFFY